MINNPSPNLSLPLLARSRILSASLDAFDGSNFAARAAGTTFHISMYADAPYHMARLCVFNFRTAGTWTVDNSAAASCSAAAFPYLNADSNAQWIQATYAGAASITVPAGTSVPAGVGLIPGGVGSSIIPGVRFSDPILLGERTPPVNANNPSSFPTLLARGFVNASAGFSFFGKQYNPAYRAITPQSRYLTSSSFPGDFVTANQGTFAGSDGNDFPWSIVPYIYYDRLAALIVVPGDSIAASVATNGGVNNNGWAVQATRNISNPHNVFATLDIGWSGITSSQYWLIFTSLITTMIAQSVPLPQAVLIPVMSPNDQTTTQAGADISWLYAMLIYEFAIENGIKPILVAPFPNNGLNSVSLDTPRQVLCRRIADMGLPFIDNNAPFFNVNQGWGWITSPVCNADAVHPNDLGHQISGQLAGPIIARALGA